MKQMKLLIPMMFFSLLLTSCSKQSGEVFAFKETEIVEVDAKEVVERKNLEAYSEDLVQNDTEENLIKASSSLQRYLLIISEAKENKTPEKLLSNIESLNQSLFQIYKNNAELYLNLFNAVLSENQKVPLKIQIDESNPYSIKMGLQTIMRSLNVKSKKTKILNLSEQYLIFNLILNLREGYGLLSHEILNELEIGNYVNTMIDKNKLSGNEALVSYQILNTIFKNDYDLRVAFKDVFCDISLTEKNSTTQKDLYFRLSTYKHKDLTKVDFRDANCIAQDLKNLRLLAKESINLLRDSRSERVESLLKTLDLNITAHTDTLKRFAAENSIDNESVDLIFEENYQQVISPLNQLLSNEKDAVKNAFSSSCPLFTSHYLKNLFGSFLKTEGLSTCLNLSDSNESPEQRRRRVLSYAEIFLRNEKEQDSVINNINKYNLILNTPVILKELNTINFRENLSVTDTKMMRELVNKIQTSAMSLVSKSENQKEHMLQLERCLSLNETVRLQESLAQNSESITIEKGIYCADEVKTSKMIRAHPLAIIIPLRNRVIIEAKGIVGGMVFNVGSLEQKMIAKPISNEAVFTGQKATDKSYTSRSEVVSRRNYSCSSKGGKHGGPEGGCADTVRWLQVTRHIFEKTVDRGVSPQKNNDGAKGQKGFSIELVLSKRFLVETPIISIGEHGYKGLKGFNSPMCNERNEYWPLQASEFNYQCTTEETNLDSKNNCQSINPLLSNLKTFHVSAGLPGNGGMGGEGGDLIFKTSTSNDQSFPFISLGGEGGFGGDAPDCIPYIENEIKSTKYSASEGQLGKSGRFILQVVE